jgi:hypothetical protein
MSSEQSAGRSIDHGSSAIKLDEVWVASAAKDHAYGKYYRREAERLVKDAVDRIRSSSGRPLDLDWEIPLTNGTVTVRPDHITVIEAPGMQSVTIQRWRTGKPPKKPKSDEIYALYAKGAELAYPSAEATIETLYLSTNEVQAIPMTTKQIASGLEKYDVALSGILRQEYPPVPDDWHPHYFICPASAFSAVKTDGPLVKRP